MEDPEADENEYFDDIVLIEGDVKIRGGKLYLTVTKDKVSDLKGKTLTFEQKRPKNLNQVLKTAS